ncbi:titin homolog isoform X5 [Drosophila sechellia]|uniref:titin homolog isoform X5 n=1 Tax=Drosophila sechellia TaxID=7238 RepID=UPI0013DE1C6D|nr:titin homolog isoform X5 [Drosophila sechellia]
MTTASLPRVPEGLRDLMKVYTKEVLREKPADLYGFSASFFNMIVGEKSHQSVRKYEPVQTYETIMKNRIRQQVPLSMVFNIIPEKLTDLIKQFIKAVLREKPDNIYIFAQEYFQRMSKEKSGRIEYSKYSSYEKSLKDKENLTPATKVTCECGRVLSANRMDVENTASVYTDNKLAEADQLEFSSRITYIQSVVIIQRHFRRYLNERKIGREKDKCNSVEYVAAILLIQRQVRRHLAQKRVEKLKNSRDAQKADVKPKAADYMKAVVVIQRHYRIYLKKKQEQNRLKHGPVSLATAAIIIQRAYRRMVARHRAKRTTSTGTDQAEELNDNASETGSYTSVSTALLSTESTELGMANFEERVHQKIIHEDEEVENSNVDAGLEKEYFAEAIKGEQKSINLRKSEILSGALIESMICKPDLQNIKDLNNESKEFDVELEVNEHQPAKLEEHITEEKRTTEDSEPEFIVDNKTSLDLETIPQVEVKAENKSKDYKSASEDQLKSNKSSLDAEQETHEDSKDKPLANDLDPKTDDAIKAEDSSSDLLKESREEDSALHNNIEKKESEAVQENIVEPAIPSSNEPKNEEKDKIQNSESQLQEVPLKNEITPTVSIEIEHVEDILEDSSASPHDSKANDLTEGVSVAEEPKSIPNVEVDSVKTILINHNLEGCEQETPFESLGENNLEASLETQSVVLNEKIQSSDTHEKIREKRSTEDEDNVQSNSDSQDVLIIENPVDQEEIHINNDQKLDLDGKSEIIPKVEDVPKTTPNTKDDEVSGSTEKVEINNEEPLDDIVNLPNHEITFNKLEAVSEHTQERMGDLPSEDKIVEHSNSSLAEEYDLPKVEKESISIDDLEATKEVLGDILLSETDLSEQNIKENVEESDKPHCDDSPKELENLKDKIKMLSQEEVIPIESESSETKGSFTEKTSIFSKNNSKETNNESQNVDDITERTQLKNETDLLVSHISVTSPGLDDNDKITPNASDIQDTAASTELSVIDGEISIGESESLKAEPQHSETEQVENQEMENEAAEIGKIIPEHPDDNSKDLESCKETAPINLEPEKVEDEIEELKTLSKRSEEKIISTKTESVQDEDAKITKKSEESSDDAEDENKAVEKIIDMTENEVSASLEKPPSSAKENSTSLNENPSSEKEKPTSLVKKPLSEKEKSPSLDEEPSLEKEKSTSLDEKPAPEKEKSTSLDKNTEEDLVQESQKVDEEMSKGKAAIAVVDLPATNKGESVNSPLNNKPSSQELQDIRAEVITEKETGEPFNLSTEKHSESESSNKPSNTTSKDIEDEDSIDHTKPVSEKVVENMKTIDVNDLVLEDDSSDDPSKLGKTETPDTKTVSPDIKEKDIVEAKHEGDSPQKPEVITGLAEASEARLDSVEDPLLLSQSDFGGLVQSLDIASTQELLNDFLQNEIEYSSRQGPFPSTKLLEEVIEEPCIKRTASLINVSECESESDIASQKVENTDSSLSDTASLGTLSADTIDKATVKLSKPEEVIEKMSQLRDSKSHERISSADPSFDEPVIRTISSLQEQSSLDIEDGDIIVYNRLQRDETRESSAQSDSVVFGDAVSENNQEKELLNEEESGRVHLMRHYTIAGDDPRGLFRSVTIDDALSYVENGANGMGASSFCLDDETSENIRKKMMAYSLSETDSDYFDPKKVSSEDFEIDTAMADAMGTSTETESTIVSAATKIQAGARGFLTRRRLRRASAGTKSSTLDTKASFGNDAISESLERFIEEEAAKKIQTAYRMHTRKRKGHSRKMEGISLESNLAARRQKLQRGDALRNDSTPDDENSLIVSGVKAQKNAKTQRSKTVGEVKSSADMELRWLKMRQNSMPVQIDCEVFRVIPKHMRKRIKSAEANKRK